MAGKHNAPKRKKGKDSGSGYYDDLFDEQTMRPRGGVPIEKQNRRYTWMRRAIMVSAFAGAISLPLWAVTITTQPQAPKAQVQQLASDGKATAMSEVTKWLKSKPAPLPGGSLQSWDGYDTMSEPDVKEMQRKDSQYQAPTYSIQVHHMTVLDKSGKAYTADVQVAVDPAQGTHVLGAPSLVPRTPDSDQFDVDSVWPGMNSSGTVPDPVTTAINAWAKAYTSGNAADLRQAVGDPDNSHTYVPISGVRQVSATTDDAAYFTHTEGDQDVQEDRMLVRVALKPIWNGQVVSADDQDKLPSLTYDVYVQDVNSASPKVVAWGGPGDGPKLKPYGNAINVGDNSTSGSGDDATEAPTEGSGDEPQQTDD